MKRKSVDLDREQARRLRYLALRENCSFEAIVQRALEEYLVRHGLEPGFGVDDPARRIPEDEWQARFDAVLERIRAGVPSDMSPEEIEAEITAASEEVRQERIGRRRTSSA